MTTISFLPLGLVLHISGITMMAGTIFAGFLTNLQLWKCLPDEKDRALTIFRVTSRFRVAQAVGGLLIIVGGVMMMLAVHGAFMHQTWFKIKLAILAFLILNMIVLERPAARQLKQMLYRDRLDAAVMVATMRRTMTFYLLQLGIFVLIFVISAYKFN
ncbi:MAG TPA: hypothetical protein VG605_05600 [Puia sp.]|nr:hypothetical protein [Puia sp.]